MHELEIPTLNRSRSRALRPSCPRLWQPLESFKSNLPFAALQLAYVSLAEFCVSRQVDLPPAALLAQFANLRTQSHADIGCHTSSIRLFCEESSGIRELR